MTVICEIFYFKFFDFSKKASRETIFFMDVMFRDTRTTDDKKAGVVCVLHANL